MTPIDRLKRWMVTGESTHLFDCEAGDTRYKDVSAVEDAIAYDYEHAASVIGTYALSDYSRNGNALYRAIATMCAFSDQGIVVQSNRDTEVHRLSFESQDETLTSIASDFRNPDRIFCSTRSPMGDSATYEYRISSRSLQKTSLMTYPTDFDTKLDVSGVTYSVYEQAVKDAGFSLASVFVKDEVGFLIFLYELSSRRGFGRRVRKFIASFYNEMSSSRFAQVVMSNLRYRNISHHLLLSNVDPSMLSASHRNFLAENVTLFESSNPYGLHVGDSPSDGLNRAWSVSRLRSAETIDQVVSLFKYRGLTLHDLERFHPVMLKEKEVWDSIIPHLSPQDMLMNLHHMSASGSLRPNSRGEGLILEGLSQFENGILKSPPPLDVLRAAVEYDSYFTGVGLIDDSPNRYRNQSVIRSYGTYEVSEKITEKLQNIYHKAFDYMPTNGHRIIATFDVSDSMWLTIVPSLSPLAPIEVVAYMMMYISRKWDRADIYAFGSGMLEVEPVSSSEGMKEIIDRIALIATGNINFGLPFHYAITHKLDYDGFIVMSDDASEYGHLPEVWLDRYRNEMMNPDTRFAAVNIMSRVYHVALDKEDHNSLSMIGFDSRSPQTLNAFMSRRF